MFFNYKMRNIFFKNMIVVTCFCLLHCFSVLENNNIKTLKLRNFEVINITLVPHLNVITYKNKFSARRQARPLYSEGCWYMFTCLSAYQSMIVTCNRTYLNVTVDFTFGITRYFLVSFVVLHVPS